MRSKKLSVTEIKRSASEIIGQLLDDHLPVIITEHGREVAVMLDADTYQTMMKKIELLDVISGGEMAFRDGHCNPHHEVRERMSRRWG